MTSHAQTDADPRVNGPHPMLVGVMTWLTSDLMLFGALFATYFFLRSRTAVWPPDGVELDLLWSSVFTVVLVSSSATMQLGARAAGRGQWRALLAWTLATWILGAMFLANQLREYADASFLWSTHAYGSIYWTATGVHAAHVLGGLVLMLALIARVRDMALGRPERRMVEAVTWYWHFVDVVWIGLFATIFLVR